MNRNKTTALGSSQPPGRDVGRDRIMCSQINLHHCQAATLGCGQRLVGPNQWTRQDLERIDIAMVQEPYLNNGQVKIFHNNINIYSSSEPDNRACVLMNKNIKGFLMQQFTARDQTVVQIKLGSKNIFVISVYMPYDSPNSPPSELLKNTVDFAQDNNISIIIGTDSNSHNTSWGSTNNNKRGEDLLEYILHKNLIVINEGTTPTFVTANRKEILDLTIISSDLINKITDWKVSNIESFSDHKYLDFTLNLQSIKNEISFRNVRKTDWDLYREKLAENRKNTGNLSNYDIDTAAEKLQNDIIGAFHDSCKESTGNGKSKPPWWNHDLAKSKKNVLRLKRRMERKQTEERIVEYRSARNEHVRMVNKAKRKSWQTLCNEMKDLNYVAKIQKIMKMGQRKTIGTIKKGDGTYTKDEKESLIELLNTHFPDEISQENEIPFNHEINDKNIDVDKVINLESVRESIKSFKPYKSPGYDNIYPALLQKGLDILENDILELYRRSVKLGKSPRSWLKSRVTFIPKPGKKDYTEPKSVRPINLASFLLKGLERCLFWDLNDTVIKHKINKNIFSYREGISTEDAIHNVVTKIEKAFENNEVALLLFCDMDAAFSTANITSMIRNLTIKGAPVQTMIWAEDMLRNMEVTASLNGKEVSKKNKRGTPQGGVGSIHFWNGCKDDLHDRIPENGPTELNVFADDSLDMAVGIDEDTCARNIQRDVKIMETWAKDHSLRFNPQKTKLMMCTRRKNVKKPKITMCGVELEYVSSYKYLGVTITETLNWKEHVKNVTQKATYTLINARKMISRSWGLNPEICRWMYISLIRPIMAYASLVWIRSTEIKSHKTILNKVQRKGCMAVLNAMHTTPTAAMELMLNLEPIDIFLKTQAINTYKRLLDNGNWRVKEGEIIDVDSHVNIVKRITRRFEFLHYPRDKLLNTEFISTNFNTEILSRKEANNRAHRPMPSHAWQINCYTDGSRFDNRSGYAYIIFGESFRKQDFKHLGREASVFQSEILAVQEAAHEMLIHEIEDKDIRIHIDNQAAIKTLGSYRIRSKIAAGCKMMINKLSEKNNVTLTWIPGHSNHKGNEIADRLAKRGTNLKAEGPLSILPIAEATIKDEIKQWSNKVQQIVWRRRTDCRQSKMAMPKIGNHIWKQIRKHPRRKMNIITQILTGHTTLKRHLNVMTIEDESLCQQCMEDNTEETMEHFILQCPAFARNRQNILGKIYMEPEEFSEIKISKLLKFVKQTKRFDQERTNLENDH